MPVEKKFKACSSYKRGKYPKWYLVFFNFSDLCFIKLDLKYKVNS